MTAATTSLSTYLPPANVPTVSLTRAVTFISRPCLSIALLNSPTTSSPTVPLMEKPLVHLIRVPDDIDVWCTGKEKVKPSSLCLPSGRWKSSPSVRTKFSSSAAMKSNRSVEVPTIR
uniref:HXK6 n=1 Tax=Arundo donax TaxID=35708 RepID=A0A0A9CN16_ARUDO